MSDLPEDRLITRKALTAELDVSRETVRRWLRAGRLPKPDVFLSHKTMAWRLSTLQSTGLL